MKKTLNSFNHTKRNSFVAAFAIVVFEILKIASASINDTEAVFQNGQLNRSNQAEVRDFQCMPSASNKKITTRKKITTCPAGPSQIQFITVGKNQENTKDVIVSAEKKESENIIRWLDFFSKIAWPLVALIFSLIYGSKILDWLNRRVKKFKKGDLEIEFTPEAAEKVRESVSSVLKEFAEAADIAYRRQSTLADLEGHLRRAEWMVRQEIDNEGLGNNAGQQIRATVHVPDIVYSNHLYQLANYIPSGDGIGRRFSVRRGILGRAWRLQKSLGAGTALDETDHVKHADPASALVYEWSMTFDEARKWHQKPRPAFLCVMLRVNDSTVSTLVERRSRTPGRVVGVFYMDAISENAFGDDKDAVDFAKRIETSEEVLNLARAVDSIMIELRKAHTNIKIENG